MDKSIWLKDGVSTFPVLQPMVGQEEFYRTFKEYIKDIKSAPMARIFIEIGKWGVGKTRTGFELIAEALGISKGWIIRNKKGELEDVTILKPDLADGILPVYLRYSQMSSDYLFGDNWVAYGTYRALSLLSDESPLASIQGTVIKLLQDQLRPAGFSPSKLAEIIEMGKHNEVSLLSESQQLDELVEKGLDYLKNFGIDHLMIIVDEVESETELIREGIHVSEEWRKKLDGAAIKVITSAIKHEDSRSRHPRVSYLLLCSPAIGDQIKALEALDRRGEVVEIFQNSFSDISDYVQFLQSKSLLRTYPEGLIEAAYTIAGGNFGWMNVQMAYCDQYLDDHPTADTGEILEDRAVAVSRVRDKLIDRSHFQYISLAETDPNLPVVRRALLRQLPYPVQIYDDPMKKLLHEVKQIDGTAVFKDFMAVSLNKGEVGMYLTRNGYKLISDDEFVHDTSGTTFNLEVMLRSLGTFSITAPEGKYIVGIEKDTFLEQVRMLYPKDGVEDAAFIIYDFIQQQLVDNPGEEYIGPSFSFLERLDRRYATKKGISNYLLRDEDDQKLKEELKKRRQKHNEEIKRVLTGFARAIEIDYPNEDIFTVQGVQGIRTIVNNHLYLGTHPDNKVDIIWDNQSGNLKEVLSSKQITSVGAHPVIVVSLSATTDDELKKIREHLSNASRFVLFFHLTNLQKEALEVISVEKEWMDIRENAHQLSPQFQNRLRAIRDEISKKSKEWFENLDREGHILRPIIFSKSEEENLSVLADGYARMLCHDAGVVEIGAKPEIKIETEQFTKFQRTLNHTLVRSKLAKEGYRDTGIFIKEDDEFQVEVPAAFASLMRFIGNSKRTLDNIRDYFFFSAVDTIKPKKIVEQWVYFLQELKVVTVEDNKYAVNITKTDLAAKLDQVKTWLNNDYDKLVDSFKGIISDGKIKDLHDYKVQFQKKAEDAGDTLNKINLKPLQDNLNDKLLWKEQLKYLADFHDLCDYIYNKEKWEQTSYNENSLQELRIDDKDVPIWKRLRLIERFHDYISTIQVKVLERIDEKITEIKAGGNYKDYNFPISPFTNALNRFKTEIEFARDYSTSSMKMTMVSYLDTLAAKLWFAEYKEAVQRLYSILNDLGLEKGTYVWKESGIVGKYSRNRKTFCDLVDGYEANAAEVDRWINYYKDAPSVLQNDLRLKNMKAIYTTLNLFLNGGFEQEIDDHEAVLSGKPVEFITHLETVLGNHKSDITSLLSTLMETKKLAREERNRYYDQLTVNSVNFIRKISGNKLIDIDTAVIPTEKTYQEAKKKAEDFMHTTEQEGRQYLKDKGAKYVTFEFFKDVVACEAELDWSTYNEQKRELESVGLIETKVVLKR